MNGHSRYHRGSAMKWIWPFVIFAASSVSLALNDFYSQLSDEQKSKLNSTGS